MNDSIVPVSLVMTENHLIRFWILDDQSHEEICNKLMNDVISGLRSTVINGTVECQEACICVVRDQIIFALEPKEKVSKEQLLDNSDRLCISQNEDHFGIQLHPLLVKQYQVDDNDLKHLLLSPRSRYNNDSGTYQCCQSCYRSLTSSKREEVVTPPKLAIANGFAIGQIPDVLTYTNRNNESFTRAINLDSDLDEKMCAAIAPIRPFGFVHAFTGGSQKSITGHF